MSGKGYIPTKDFTPHPLPPVSKPVFGRMGSPVFRPGQFVLMREPGWNWDATVEFRGHDDDVALILYRGETRQVPLSWLKPA